MLSGTLFNLTMSISRVSGPVVATKKLIHLGISKIIAVFMSGTANHMVVNMFLFIKIDGIENLRVYNFRGLRRPLDPPQYILLL